MWQIFLKFQLASKPGTVSNHAPPAMRDNVSLMSPSLHMETKMWVMETLPMCAYILEDAFIILYDTGAGYVTGWNRMLQSAN